VRGTMSFDAVIVGAGAAGAAAGASLARRGFQVALVDRDRFPRGDTGIGWVGARAATLLAEFGVDPKPLLDHAINQVRFFDSDLGKTALPQRCDALGYVIDRSAFEQALIEAAAEAGAALHPECDVTRVEAREDEVELHIAGREPICGRIVVLASGRQSRLARKLGLAAHPPTGALWAAYLDAACDQDAKDVHAVNIILGLTRDGGFGVTVASGKRLMAAAYVPGSRETALTWLSRTCKALAAKGILPSALENKMDRAVVGAPWPAALDMESHVGKHTLVIGEAGGFVAATSLEGLVPGMWSAKIAAEVIEAALRGPRSQDELMTFDTRWRLEMADYLRLPNTDVQFLVPLVFSNQPMADRMAAAFFLGENI
jgi:flavin-dependent dehydrogenase